MNDCEVCRERPADIPLDLTWGEVTYRTVEVCLECAVRVRDDGDLRNELAEQDFDNPGRAGAIAGREWVLEEQEWGRASHDGPVTVLVVSRGSDGVADSEGPAFRSRQEVDAFIRDLQVVAARAFGGGVMRCDLKPPSVQVAQLEVIRTVLDKLFAPRNGHLAFASDAFRSFYGVSVEPLTADEVAAARRALSDLARQGER